MYGIHVGVSAGGGPWGGSGPPGTADTGSEGPEKPSKTVGISLGWPSGRSPGDWTGRTGVFFPLNELPEGILEAEMDPKIVIFRFRSVPKSIRSDQNVSETVRSDEKVSESVRIRPESSEDAQLRCSTRPNRSQSHEMKPLHTPFAHDRCGPIPSRGRRKRPQT